MGAAPAWRATFQGGASRRWTRAGMKCEGLNTEAVPKVTWILLVERGARAPPLGDRWCDVGGVAELGGLNSGVVDPGHAARVPGERQGQERGDLVELDDGLAGRVGLDDDVLKGAVGELAAIDRDGPRASFQVPPDWRGASIDDWKPPGAVCDVSFRGRVRLSLIHI